MKGTSDWRSGVSRIVNHLLQIVEHQRRRRLGLGLIRAEWIRSRWPPGSVTRIRAVRCLSADLGHGQSFVPCRADGNCCEQLRSFGPMIGLEFGWRWTQGLEILGYTPCSAAATTSGLRQL